MSEHTTSQKQLQPAEIASPAGRILQRQCACGNHAVAGSECDSCRKKHESASLQPTVRSTAPVFDERLIVHEVLNSPGQPLGPDTRAFMEPRFGKDFSRLPVRPSAMPRLSFRPQHLVLRSITEEGGSAACDPSVGKVKIAIDYNKIPFCMSDCAFAHERAHADFMQAECAKVSFAWKRSDEAMNKAKGSTSEADLKKGEQAFEDAAKAEQTYNKWMVENCRANEEKAYQAGIDKCKTKDIQEQCTLNKETQQYTQIIQNWENFKKNPPNCPAPPKEAEKEKTGGSKKDEPKKPRDPKQPPAK